MGQIREACRWSVAQIVSTVLLLMLLLAPGAVVAQSPQPERAVGGIVNERMIARRAVAAKSLADEVVRQQGARNLQLFYRNLLSYKNSNASVPSVIPSHKLDIDYLASLSGALTFKPYIWLDDHPLALGEYPSAVALMGYRLNGGVVQKTGECSGTLIARFAVLTAAHCVCELGSKIRAFLNTENYRVDAGTRVEVTAIKSRLEDCAGYLAADLEGQREMLRVIGDVAVLYLDQDAAKVNIAPAVLSDSFKPSTSYYIVGYGISDDDPSFGVRRLATIQGLACSSTAASRYGCNPAFEFWGDGRQITGRTDRPDSCAGDSGGSVFAVDDASPPQLIGIISRPVAGTTCGQGGVYVLLTPPILAWVEEQRKVAASRFPPA